MKLNYNKSNSFRVLNIDDVRIDITRNLDIQLSLCSDRSAVKQTSRSDRVF